MGNLIKTKTRFTILILTTFIVSCSPSQDKTDNVEMISQTEGPLNNFDWHKGAEFTQIKDSEAIVLELKRVDSLEFKYRIELNRQWKGSSFDTGTVTFDKVVADTCILLSGRGTDCQLQIFLSNDSSRYNLYARIERLCSDTTRNILKDDFPIIRFKTGF